MTKELTARKIGNLLFL